MTQEWDAGRLDSDLQGVGLDTLAVRAGQRRTPEGEHSEAIFPTSSYVFRTAADAAARFAGEVPGNVYSRYTNPTVRTFEERIAALEGAEQAVATASGMSAILSIVMSLCSAGDHVLVSRSVFGSTISLFEKYLKRFGVQVDYVALADLQAWEAACLPNTKLLFVESPSNPLAELVDIAALAEIAHSKGALLAVDNCFCTPALQQPIKLGADIIMHSATKYIAGLPSHPQHDLAKRQQSAFGAVVSFEVKGGKEAAWRFIDATRMISITTNLGDTKTTIAHPATTSHGRLSPQERASAGISDSLIRVAVGLEDLVDLKADLARGLAVL